MNTEDLPQTLLQFEERFATEEACLAYVRTKKWPDGFRCAKCGGRASWPVRHLEECASCGHQESVTAGTLFHQTRKPLRLWFRAITLWVMSKRGLSAMELSRQLGVHYETAWHWCHRLRACVGASFGKTPLSGVIEVDETVVGSSGDRAHGRAIAQRAVRVAGAVEVRGQLVGRLRLRPLNHSNHSKPQDFSFERVERRPHRLKTLFSLLKRVLLGTFHGSVSQQHLTAYLDEFVFRFNRRNSSSRWLLFERVLEAAPNFAPPTLAQLAAAGGP